MEGMFSKMLHRLFDTHVQHIGNRFAFVLHLQRLAVVALALALLALDIDIGEEVHLDLDEAVAFARLAPPAPDIKGEPARFVSPHLCLLCLGKDRSDLIEDFGVGCRVASRASYRWETGR